MNKWNDIMQTKMHSEIDKKKKTFTKNLILLVKNVFDDCAPS